MIYYFTSTQVYNFKSFGSIHFTQVAISEGHEWQLAVIQGKHLSSPYYWLFGPYP